METLVVVEQHRDQYCGRINVKHRYGTGRVGSPMTTARGLKGINCRSFQSGAGILPTPIKRCPSSVTKRGCTSPSFSERTPSPPSGDRLKSFVKSAPIAIKSKSLMSKRSFAEELSDGNVLFSERWAGPTYSNSPPPSSLPLPKFKLLPKRTVSLELPNFVQDSKMEVPPTAKSAPASPTRDYTNDRFGSHNFATKDLCRILNLEIAND